MAGERAHWGSRMGFIMAAAGSAVGLGNIWKFPYITGENGGGLFVLIYLACIALVGIPIMMAEIMIGRAAQKQPVGAFHALQGKRTAWAGVGWMGVIAGFIILSFYVVVAGWAMDFTLKSVVNYTQPIHDEAEQSAMNYRMTTPVEEMKKELISRAYARDEERQLAERDIRNEQPPSVWEVYDRYTSALDAAGVINVPNVQAIQSAWTDTDPKVLELTSMSMVVNTELTDEVREAYSKARDRILANKAYAEKVTLGESLLDELAEEQKSSRVRAHKSIEDLAKDESDLLDRAESLKRRSVIRSKVEEAFGAMASDGWTVTLWSAIFMFITIVIVARGVSKGIEATCRVLLPTLILIMVVMVIYGMFQPGFGEALSFVFKPDLDKLQPSGVLEALGHAFFTLSLGMGAMITYGSYQRTKGGIVGQSIAIAVLDTVIALLACMMIFPIIFTYDQEAAAGPGLVFMSMPLAFAEIGKGGMLLAILFFGLLVFAALTSAISLLEVVASYFIDEQKWSRRKAAWVVGGAIFGLAIPCAFALDPGQLMTGWEPSMGQNFFDSLDYLTSNWMLPLGGLFISIYAGWIMPRRLQKAEVEDVAPPFFMGWLLLVRFVAPALVIVVLIQKVGVLDANEFFHSLIH